MPKYDFKCNDCENVQEVQCKIAEREDEKTCEACGSHNMEQTIISSTLAFMTPEQLGRRKAPGDFRNFMSAIHKAHGGASQIRDH